MSDHFTFAVAGAAYPVERLADWKDLEEKLDFWVAQASGNGAKVLVFPEYAGIEAALIGTAGDLDPRQWCERAAGVAERYVDLCADLAKKHAVHLLGGSLAQETSPGMVNRAAFHTPDGALCWQDKQILTPWERANTDMVSGAPLKCFETDLGRIGVLICYDSEFPTLADALAPDLLLVPSCTDETSGYTRVRVSARARALECQCVVVHAPLVGDVADCALIDRNVGAAGVFGPPDIGFPDTGIMASGILDHPGWTSAEYDREAIARTRSEGAVAPLRHKSEAAARSNPVTLRILGQNRP